MTFDTKDSAYRNSNASRQAGREGFTLKASYDPQLHQYVFEYRGHSVTMPESKMMWDSYPMDTLAKAATEFIKTVDKKVGWNWEPRDEKLDHEQLLAQLETILPTAVLKNGSGNI